ncbi:MAG: MBL fold metallo-hydrolase [Ruegeria sp.]
MKLTILGSGSPEAYARRASSGYLLEVDNDVILFDCGGGVFDNLLRAGRSPSDITHLFFSHLHTDHMMDYARLVHAAWDEGAAPLKVFGPPPIAQITEGYFGPNGVLSHDLRARTEFAPSQEVWKARGGNLPRPWPAPQVQEIAPGFACAGETWSLGCCEVPHAQPFLSCLAFSVLSDGKKFVYSGDAGICDDLTAMTRDADMLLHWCYRLDGETAHPKMAALTPTPREIASMAQGAGVKQLLLTHFRVHLDEVSLHEATLETIGDAFRGRFGIVEDLQEYEI